jgi:NAD(P)-dependent dehydrogenase (short-subunit alcohol dehydrogenase family)
MTFAADSIRSLEPARLYSLAGKTATVTGGAGGIGRWLAAGLGAAGASVLVTDKAAGELSAVTETLREADIAAEPLVIDLLAADAPERIVAETVTRFGRLDVLVNCAAVNRRMPILEMDSETYDLIMNLDLRVPYFLSQAVARVMKDVGGGAIVNISSLNALYALEQISVYGPAKAGLSQLTRVMALEWAPYGIRANAIAPGFMDTPLAAPIWNDADRRRWILNRVPMRRPGEPEELVGLCLLLASDAGSYITGQTFVLDGGMLAGGRWFTPDE